MVTRAAVTLVSRVNGGEHFLIREVMKMGNLCTVRRHGFWTVGASRMWEGVGAVLCPLLCGGVGA